MKYTWLQRICLSPTVFMTCCIHQHVQYLVTIEMFSVYSVSPQTYSVFLESSGNHSTHTLRVRSSDTVGSLMDKVRTKLSKYTWTIIHTRMHACMHTHSHVRACTYPHAHVRAHTRTHTHTHLKHLFKYSTCYVGTEVIANVSFMNMCDNTIKHAV